MSLISPVLLARMRALEKKAMPDSFEALRTTPADTAEGSWTNVPATETVTSTGICRLRKAGNSAEERQIAERMQWSVAYAVKLPLDADVTPEHRLRINGTRTFEVGGVVETGRYATARIAVCKEAGT